EPDQAGFFITCTRGKEGRCVTEMYALLNDYAERMYPEAYKLLSAPAQTANDADEGSSGDAGFSVEDDIARELAALKQQSARGKGGKDGQRQSRLFTSLQTGTECVAFIRCLPPVDPVEMTMTILRDIARTGQQRTRYTNRIIPITRTCRSEISEIEQLAEQVLAPAFHNRKDESSAAPLSRTIPIQFAIQPKIRNCNRVDRDELIRTVARKVGEPHKVNLSQPEKTIIVEVFKGICGMSVVTGYNDLKRLNIYELVNADKSKESQTAESTPAEQSQDGQKAAGDGDNNENDAVDENEAAANA
ncbi:hypothetical protein THASP1DRAFT_13776, partial [Thamnocephalis sphaerospora]